jgi:outer membrane protein assembly factor BamB
MTSLCGTGGRRWTVAAAGSLALALTASAAEPMPSSDPLPPLEEGIASFGAAVADDVLYVFGGHVGKTHQHSVDNVSHQFRRLDLRDPGSGWQDLGEVHGLQGLAMVAHRGRVCRIGGLDARNPPEEDEDLVSVDEVACFDPAAGGWSELPPLPVPRSSLDAAVAGDTVYVAGGWRLRGRGQEPEWQDALLALDLSAAAPAWRSIPQPFRRRALAVAVAGGKVHVCGGLGADGTSRRVDVYDPATDAWTQGPELPIADGPMLGFGVSAFGVGDRVLLSGGDGVIYALEAGSDAWSQVGRLRQPRFFHRLLPHGDDVLFVAGAAQEGHLGDVERIALASLQATPAAGETTAEAVAAAEVTEGRWPAFRGRGDSHAPSDRLPLSWSSGDGVAWRAAVPGYGQSAPVVWDGQVFVTSVEGKEKETLILSAFDLDRGAVRWRRRFESRVHIPDSDMVSRAAPTPAVDGERVYALWETGDLVAADHDGETLWRRSLVDDYGPFAGNHGIASSPVLTADLVVVQITHEGPSYLVAFDQRDGTVRWKADRDPGVAWTTPVVLAEEGGAELVSSAAGRVEALDAATGASLWRIDDIEKNSVPSATADGELIVVASSDAGSNLALRRQGRDGAEIRWRAEGVTTGFGSPVLHGDCVLFVNKAGAVTCAGRDDGAARWTHRLPDAVWATPIAAGNRVYFFTKKGDTVVLVHGPGGPEVVAENHLPIDGAVYGVAAVRDAFLVRTGTELIRIGSPPSAPLDRLAAAGHDAAED